MVRLWSQRKAAIACLAVVAACGFAGLLTLPTAAAEKNVLRSARETITTAELRRHVDVLADDSFEGREAGARGGRAAGNYLVEKLQKLPVRPAGEDAGYFQGFGEGYRNIFVMLEGSDPDLKREYILVGAHYDHVGYGTPRNSYGPWGYIHNGADDNASGVAAVMELIDALAPLAPTLKRSILFAFWDGEEKGLLGSKHWVAQPTVPLKQVKFAVNLDMIGRLRENNVEVYGSRTAAGLRQRLSRLNDDAALALDFTWEMKDNSDHHSFFVAGVPVVMFHSRLHADYHRPGDDVEKLNNEGMTQISRLLFNLTTDMADGPSPGEFRTLSRTENPAARQTFERPLPPPTPRLGLAWNAADPGPGLLVTQLTANGPAVAAGVRVGDRLRKFHGHEIKGESDFRAAVVAAPEQVELELDRPGEKEPLKLAVTLAGRSYRVGIAWREDAGEPGTVTLVQVVPGSAADQAGLLLGDRLYELDGQPIPSGEALAQRLNEKSGARTLFVERTGRCFTATLNLGEGR